VPAYPGCPEKKPLNRCSSTSSNLLYCHTVVLLTVADHCHHHHRLGQVSHMGTSGISVAGHTADQMPSSTTQPTASKHCHIQLFQSICLNITNIQPQKSATHRLVSVTISMLSDILAAAAAVVMVTASLDKLSSWLCNKFHKSNKDCHSQWYQPFTHGTRDQYITIMQKNYSNPHKAA